MGSFPTPTYVFNHELVVTAFGYWPSFHDSEVISLLMDRRKILFDTVHNARIELVVHAFEMSAQVDEKGYFVLNKHHLVHFEFETVDEVRLQGFNHQNALMSLVFEELPRDAAGNHSFKVGLNDAFGIGGEFTSSEGRVLSVIPCDYEGNPRSGTELSPSSG